MSKILITTHVPDERTAWTKARSDVLASLRQRGYEPMALPAGTSPRDWLAFWRSLRERLHGPSHLLLEYPFDQRKRILPLLLLRRLAGTRMYGLIHDLDSLRYATPVRREIATLKQFDGLLSHNPAMTRWLREGGVGRPVVDLQLFDYLCAHDVAGPWHEDGMAAPLKVVCAGNLSYEKAGYIYDPHLGELHGVELSLFGAYFEPDRMPASPVVYKGVFDPSLPQLDGRYHFGLVWDGVGVHRCDGPYGEYMRYNNPHKLSLYVALGLPVVVWREAAIAQFVQEHGIGVVVDDLRELGQIAQRVSSAEYRGMVRKLAPLSQKARHGGFLGDALTRLIGQVRSGVNAPSTAAC